MGLTDQIRRFLRLLILVSFVSCAAHGNPSLALKTEIIVDQLTPKDALAPWLLYAGTRAHWMEKKYFAQHTGATSYKYTFPEEVEARLGCALMWRELKAKHGQLNRYLDDLIAVQEAGFIREYTWIFFWKSDWSEPEDLHLVEFDRWRQIYLRGHQPETRAIVRFQER